MAEGVNFYDGAAFQEVAALEQSDGQTAPAYRWDGSQWVKIFPAIPDSAIHRWPMDEGSGSTVADAIGSVDGTITGATWVTGTYEGGAALDFDGTGDEVDYSTISALSEANDWSLGITVEIDDLTADAEIWAHTISSSDRWGLGSGRTNGVIAFSTFDGSTRSSASVEAAATTNRIRLGIRHRASDRNIDIFVDGAEADDGTEIVGLSDTVGHKMGAQSGGSFEYAGIIDHPIAYNEYLSDSDMQADYTAQPWS